MFGVSWSTKFILASTGFYRRYTNKEPLNIIIMLLVLSRELSVLIIVLLIIHRLFLSTRCSPERSGGEHTSIGAFVFLFL